MAGRPRTKDPRERDPYVVEVGERLHRFRVRVLQYASQRAFADEIGVSKERLSNWEVGANLIHPREAYMIEKKFHAPGFLHYLYTGEVGSLKKDHYDRLFDPRLKED